MKTHYKGIDELSDRYTSRKQVQAMLKFMNPSISNNDVDRILLDLEKIGLVEKYEVIYYIYQRNHTLVPKTETHYCFNSNIKHSMKPEIEIIDEKVTTISSLQPRGGCKILHLLEQNGRMTSKELAVATKKRKNNVGNILKFLREQGIVTCNYIEELKQCDRYRLTYYGRMALSSFFENSKSKRKRSKK